MHRLLHVTVLVFISDVLSLLMGELASSHLGVESPAFFRNSYCTQQHFKLPSLWASCGEKQSHPFMGFLLVLWGEMLGYGAQSAGVCSVPSESALSGRTPPSRVCDLLLLHIVLDLKDL